MVTHPFHPLFGQRLEVLRVRRHRIGRLYVCDGGVLGSVVLAEDATDRGLERAERPLSLQVLVELATLVAALGAAGTGRSER